MKKKIILSFLLTIIMLLTVNVEAKIMTKDEIEDDSYVIGNYLFTRDQNEENQYNGQLTTPLMLLAAKSIDGNLDDMKVYYKTFLGEWINGITGESITPPNTFEIENRNLKDILPTPSSTCSFKTQSENIIAVCGTAIYLDGELKYAYDNLVIDKQYYIEYYLLKDEDGNLPEEDAIYVDGIFSAGESILTPVVTDLGGGYNSESFYQIVSRVYYLDGEEKIYSDYSNPITNGIYKKLNLSTSPILNANIVDVGMYQDPSNPLDITYYNVEFSLSNIDTDKYMVKRYEVYAMEDEDYSSDNLDAILNLQNSNEVFVELYYQKTALEKYFIPKFFDISEMLGGFYLTAEKDGATVLPEVFNDVSGEKTYSMRFDRLIEGSEVQGSNWYFAKVTLCDKNDQNVCYNALTRGHSATKSN